MAQEESRIKKLLRSPIGIFTGIVIGLLIGLYNPPLGQALGPIGNVFIDFMKMCVIPIIITSISLSVAHFLTLDIQGHVGRIIFIFCIILLFCSLIGAAVAIFTTPGDEIDPSSSTTLQQVVESASSSTRSLDEPIERKLQAGVITFLLSSVPSNIFKALADSDTFKIIIFALIFGISLGLFVKTNNPLFVIMDTIYNLFIQIFDFITLLLPIAVVCLMAQGATQVGADTIVGMTAFVAQVYLCFIILFVFSQLAIMIRTRTGLFHSLNILKYPIFIALSTSSSIASIPAAIQSMRNFNLSRDISNMLVPLGTVMGRYGNILYFSFCAIFVIQLYQIDLDPSSYLFIGVMAIFAGIASSGQTGALTLPLLAIVLDPIGVPVSAVIILFIAIDPLIDPVRTVANVHTNCAAVTLITSRESGVEPVQADKPVTA